MSHLISEEVLCRELCLKAEELQQWISAGLVQRSQVDGQVGFSPAQVRRIWSIASLSRDLDVNLEGIQIILELSDQICDLKRAVQHARQELSRLRRLDRFHLRIIEEHFGPVEWEIDL
jgi:MerR family transcriptional regulator/heat shock protein HspR